MSSQSAPDVAAVLFKPLKHGTDATSGHADARVRRAVVEVDRVAVLGDRAAAWEYHVADVTKSL